MTMDSCICRKIMVESRPGHPIKFPLLMEFKKILKVVLKLLVSSPWSDLRRSITITSVTDTHGLTFVRHFQPAMLANEYMYLKLVRATNPNILVINF